MDKKGKGWLLYKNMLLNARLILISYHFSCLKHECLVIAGNLDFYYKQNSGKNHSKVILIWEIYARIKKKKTPVGKFLFFFFFLSLKKKKKKKRKKNKERKVWKISVKLMYMSTGILDEFWKGNFIFFWFSNTEIQL